MTLMAAAQATYFVGAGVVMAGTGIRFLYGFIRNIDKKNEFIEKLENYHLPIIYDALKQIGKQVGVTDLELPRHKPLPED